VAAWTATPASRAFTAASNSASLAFRVSSCAAAWAFLAAAAARFSSGVGSAKAGVARAITITTTSARAGILRFAMNSSDVQLPAGCWVGEG
jgi:hypothetical protein